MAQVACESKVCFVVMYAMHPCSGDWVVIGRVVVCYARAARAFSAGNKCRQRSVVQTCITQTIATRIEYCYVHIGAYHYTFLKHPSINKQNTPTSTSCRHLITALNART